VKYNNPQKDGTQVTTTSMVYKEFVEKLDENSCREFGGCTCILNGYQTPCTIVFACLKAGFCERVNPNN